MHRDLDIALQYVDRTLPTFVYGHALGAAIAVSFCAMNPHVNFQGVITTNAYFTLPAKYTCVKLWLVRLLKKALPNLMVNLYPSYTLASKNNYHIKKLAEDPLLQPFMTIRTAFEVMKLTDFILPNAGKFNSPILLIHGKLDRIVSHMGSVEFYGKCGSTERTLKIFEYGYHELHSDTEKDRL
jgi:alpha-beta hydrolase superfamily lysophospholipase